ncbi:MAG: iron complex outermembrane receptor protein, partial [Alteromonadaceae bacterium]
MNSKKTLLATLMAYLFSGSAVVMTASAQDTDTKVSEEQADKNTTDSQLEVIIVTSQKRSERLQDIPVSVTAFSSRALKVSNAESGIEIVRQTPNLVASVLGNESQPKFSLRGVSSSEFNLNAVSPTGVFYDEVYISAQYLGGAQTFDLERIEVLRGPQGTLFGKNTTAGAVNYISATPAYDFEGDLSVTYGSKNYRQLKGAVEAPLVDDRLTARIAFDVADSDGYIENVNPEVSDRSDIDHK